MFQALARCPPDGGLCFSLQPGRSPEHQTKERQQRQEHKASHAANLPYPASGSLRRTERMGRKPRNGGHLSFLGRENQYKCSLLVYHSKRSTFMLELQNDDIYELVIDNSYFIFIGNDSFNEEIDYFSELRVHYS